MIPLAKSESSILFWIEWKYGLMVLTSMSSLKGGIASSTNRIGCTRPEEVRASSHFG